MPQAQRGRLLDVTALVTTTLSVLTTAHLGTEDAQAGLDLQRAPTQIFSLFKLLSYPHPYGTVHGDEIDSAFSDVDPRGRTIVDVGLNECTSLAKAVSKGFVVHGFEPRQQSIDCCHAELRKVGCAWLDVDVSLGASVEAARKHRMQQIAAGTSPGAEVKSGVPSGAGESGLRTCGFAYLYRATLGNSSARMRMSNMHGSSTLADSFFTSHTKSSTLYHKFRTANRTTVRVVRLDDPDRRGSLAAQT